MSAFDPVDFLNNPQNAGFDTRFPLHKAGDWDGYVGSGDKDFNIRVVDGTDKETGQHVDRPILEVGIYTENPAAVGEGGTAPARCRLSIWLDPVPGWSKDKPLALDSAPGKNRGLGYLLTATGHQSKDGKQIKPWSRASLAGCRVKYRVSHTPRKNDPNATIDAEVTQVAAPV